MPCCLFVVSCTVWGASSIQPWYGGVIAQSKHTAFRTEPGTFGLTGQVSRSVGIDPVQQDLTLDLDICLVYRGFMAVAGLGSAGSEGSPAGSQQTQVSDTGAARWDAEL